MGCDSSPSSWERRYAARRPQVSSRGRQGGKQRLATPPEIPLGGVRVVTIPVERIHDWESSHDVFASAVHFPDIYGRNLDSWAEQVGSLDAPDLYDEPLAEGEMVTLQLGEVTEFP